MKSTSAFAMLSLISLCVIVAIRFCRVCQ